MKQSYCQSVSAKLLTTEIPLGLNGIFLVDLNPAGKTLDAFPSFGLYPTIGWRWARDIVL